jgi:hypothetical protein
MYVLIMLGNVFRKNVPDTYSLLSAANEAIGNNVYCTKKMQRIAITAAHEELIGIII